ncbi:hypothetical protein [Nocardioides sp.]|uniref:hypothetical protein n=1 Tax=Nocardioides sp. TaxID=35761 RepID=UPI003D09FC9C
MKKLISTAVLGVAGLTSLGLLSLQTTQTSAQPKDEFVKREEDTPSLVLVADDDDDDTNDNSRSRTGKSRDTGDHTRSNFTAVSRDRDKSRGDKTRDWTKDGKGPQKRDWSANKTNDRSRNDTRGGRR